MLFRDRADAGLQLARKLEDLQLVDPLVVALPRGGVVLGYEVAQLLGVPLEVAVVRKLGAPSNPEFAVGAITEDNIAVYNERAIRSIGLSLSELRLVEEGEKPVLNNRLSLYRGRRPPFDLHGRTVVLVDDGLATGMTAIAAARLLRRRGAKSIVLAVPVGARDSVEALSREVDRVVCLHTPEMFGGVGAWYMEFGQVTDAQVIDYLNRVQEANRHRSEVTIPADFGELHGELVLPTPFSGIVVFAHGSGSGRFSPRNNFVASTLQSAGIGTLLFDLLTMDESRDREKVFDIQLLAGRLELVTNWLEASANPHHMPVGYFGASTGAAAALQAAATASFPIAAIVSRGGRPDLAGPMLGAVTAPTLLVVGGDDTEVLELNRAASKRMTCERQLEIVPGATHLFEESGALEAVSHLATDWFSRWFKAARATYLQTQRSKIMIG